MIRKVARQYHTGNDSTIAAACPKQTVFEAPP
jgi:hypothetical protein